MEESPAHEKGREGYWFRLSSIFEGAGVGKLAKPGFFHSDLVTSELPGIGCFTLVLHRLAFFLLTNNLSFRMSYNKIDSSSKPVKQASSVAVQRAKSSIPVKLLKAIKREKRGLSNRPVLSISFSECEDKSCY